MARRVIENALQGQPDLCADERVQKRRRKLVRQARLLLEAIRRLAAPGVTDPWSDAATLARAVTCGILDAPQLRNNPFARGAIQTRILEGKCLVVDTQGHPLGEEKRLEQIFHDRFPGEH